MTTARRLVVCLAIAAFALAMGVDAQDKKKDDKKKTPTINQIMKAVPGKGKLVEKFSSAAKGDKWDDAKKIGTELKTYGEAMGKNTPKKGEKESWEKHAKTFSETMTAFADAADKKDKDAIADGVAKFGKSCGGCHSAHK